MNVTGLSPTKKFHLVTGATTNINSITAVPTLINGIGGWSTVTCYLKVFDLNKPPTLGTDIPFMTAMLPANTPQHILYGINPRVLKNGLAIAVTLNPADLDTTVLAAANTSGVEISYSPSNSNP